MSGHRWRSLQRQVDIRQQLVLRDGAFEIDVVKVHWKISRLFSATRQPVSVEMVNATGNGIGRSSMPDHGAPAARNCFGNDPIAIRRNRR